MTDETTPKGLTVIEGGKGKSKRSGKTPSGLTAKQEAFARGLADGLSNADSYRAAYDTASMLPATVHNEACKLAARQDIAARVDALIKEKQRKNSMFTDKQRERNSDRIWSRIWSMLDDAETPAAVKASLLSLGAKAAGMLTDQVKIEQTTTDSKSIEAEIIERLQRLTA